MPLIYWILILLSLIVCFESLYAFCFYKPSSNEGYIQIWNLNHHSKNIDLFLTFMISNQGTGDLNNGVTIYINDKEKKQSYLKMLEFTNDYLQAIENELNIVLERRNKLIYKNNKLFIEIHSEEINPIFEMNMVLTVNLNQSIKSNYRQKEKNIFYEIVYFNYQNIEFKFDSQAYSSYGFFGLECLHSEDNILDIAKNIYFFRNYESQYKIAIILFDLTSKDIIQGNIHISKQTISLTEGIINYNENIFVFHNNDCKVQTEILHEAGGFYVLSNVSKLLQWFLKLIGINPYIKHYLSTLSLNCNEVHTTLSPIQFTHIHF